jgi:hypothetical protein
MGRTLLIIKKDYIVYKTLNNKIRGSSTQIHISFADKATFANLCVTLFAFLSHFSRDIASKFCHSWKHSSKIGAPALALTISSTIYVSSFFLLLFSSNELEGRSNRNCHATI